MAVMTLSLGVIAAISVFRIYNVGDYVVIAVSANENPVHYIGLLVEQEQFQGQKTVGDDDEDVIAGALSVATDWEFKICRRESRSFFTFIQYYSRM